MHVALVCPYAWDRPGGVRSHIASLARSLRARGHRVDVIGPRSMGRTEAGDSDVVVVGRALGVPANGSIAPIAFGPRAAAGIRRVLSNARPDVVHMHEPLIPSLSLLTLLSWSGPAVGTFHAARSSSDAYRLASPLLNKLIERLTIRTAVSDAARALVARYFPGEYRLTPNGVDVLGFSEAPLENLGPGRTILFLGRVERRKGLEPLIQAMTRLRDLNVTLVVAGDGPEARRCRRLAEQLAVPARFLGAVGDGRRARLLRSTDLYCAPGLGGESFGIVLVEAMAAGAPVVCSDLPGFRSAAGAAALFTPAGDTGRLADALRMVLSDRGRADSMRAAGTRSARMFDWSRLVPNVESIYEEAVSSAAPARIG